MSRSLSRATFKFASASISSSSTLLLGNTADSVVHLLCHLHLLRLLQTIRLSLSSVAFFQEQMEFKFITSNRGKKLLCVENFLFRVNRKSDTKCYWKCKEPGCKANAKTIDDLFIEVKGEHHHEHNGREISKRIFIKRAKEEIAKNPLKTIPNVFQETRSKHLNEGVENINTEDVEAGTPILVNSKSTLYNERSKFYPRPAKELSDIIIEGKWAKTLDKNNRNFLLANDGNDERILLFGTIDLVQRLCSAKIVYMDGTFKSCPPPFKQIYTIHCFVLGKMVPIIFGLLPNKSENTYRRFLNLIKDLAKNHQLNFYPELFQIDFELATMNAIRNVFPRSLIRGCFFHFVQSIWRKVQEVGLSNDYKDNVEITLLVRRLGALPLLPIEMLDDVWIEVFNSAPSLGEPLYDKTKLLLDYFTKTWLDCPRFHCSIWSHYDNNGARTNNHLEGWHSSLNKSINKAHPNLFEIIEKFQKQQIKNDEDIRFLLRGNPPPKPKKIYRQLDDRLKDEKKKLEDKIVSGIEFLDAVGNFIKFKG